MESAMSNPDKSHLSFGTICIPLLLLEARAMGVVTVLPFCPFSSEALVWR